MLETDHALESLERLWWEMGCIIELPEAEDRYFSVKGFQSSRSSDQRQFPRYHYRNKAFLQHVEQWSAIYAKDLSHSSIGFLHAEQLYPCDIVQICFLNGTKVNMTIRRCRRLQRHCYECGGHIDTNNRLTAQAMRELIQGQNAGSMG